MHGHTPVDRPLADERRVAVDTGAYASGVLSAAIQLASAFCPRPLAWIPGLLGVSGWLLAASLVPRFGWPREPWPLWMLISSAALWLAVQILLMALRVRWRRTLRGHGVDISDGAAIWWGLGIVVLSLGITAAGFFAFLMAVGAY